MIETTLGWTVHSRSWLRHIEQQLSDETKRGVRDELGVLAIHTAFADRFFPGTSVQQTRLRYVLFVPWIYEWLGDQELEQGFHQELPRAEVRLVKQLSRSAENGVIGETIYPRPAVQPPSAIYWTAIRIWGLLRPFEGGYLSRRGVHQVLAYGDRAGTLRDDDGEPIGREVRPFYDDLPEPPPGFLDASKPLDFRLTTEERTFLRDRLMAVQRESDAMPTLFAHLAEKPDVAGECTEAWDPRIRSVADPADRTALTIARRASHLAGVVRAAYAALVETVREKDGFGSEHEHRQRLEIVRAESEKAATSLELNVLLEFMPGWGNDGLFRTLEATQNWLKAGVAGPLEDLRPVYAAQEAARKGVRARLPDTAAARERRVEWDFPEQHRLDYRWSHVKTFLADLAADV